MSNSPVEAVLQAGDTETLYRRAGDGPPVLLLCAGVLADPLGGRLFERLATRTRVVAARVPRNDDPADVLAGWLDELTEGLGLVRPTVVIDESLATLLLEGGLVSPDAFAGVVVAVESDAAALGRASRLAGDNVLVVPVEHDDAAMLAAAMLPFMTRQGARAGRC